MTTARKIIKNFLSLSIAEVISKIFIFLAVIYLARILGVANFGKISFTAAILTYFMLITNLGLVTLGTRGIARDRSIINEYVNNIISLRLLLALISFLLLILLTILIPKPYDVKYLIIFYGFSLLPFALSLEWVFQGTEKMEYVGLSKIFGYLIYFILVIAIIKNSTQLLTLPYLWFIGNTIACAFLIYIFVKQFGGIKFNFNLWAWKSLLRRALPMGFAWVMIQIYNNFDTIMLSFMKDDKEVGWYNAAYRIVIIIFFLGGFYIISIFPVVSKYYKESMEKLKTLLFYSAKLMILLGLPLGVGGVILAKPIMNLFYGSQYDGGIIAFQILIWYVVISFICMVYANSLLACDKEKKYAIGVTLAAITNLILNAVLIPHFGLKGAAIATVASECVLFTYAYIEFQKVIKLEFGKYFLKPLFSAILMGGILYLNIDKNLFFLISIGAGVYITSLFLTKGISKEDVNMLRYQLLKSKIE